MKVLYSSFKINRLNFIKSLNFFLVNYSIDDGNQYTTVMTSTTSSNNFTTEYVYNTTINQNITETLLNVNVTITNIVHLKPVNATLRYLLFSRDAIFGINVTKINNTVNIFFY